MMIAGILAMLPGYLMAGQTQQLVFGYCDGYDGGIGATNYTSSLKAAIQIEETTAASWAGSRLTQVRVAIGVTTQTKLTLYLSDELNSKPFYEQQYDIAVYDGWNEITLDTPFEIDGGSFYIGYEMTNVKAGEYPLGIDGVTTDLTLGDNVYLASGGWDHIGSMLGNLCIQAVVEGENLPINAVAVTDLQLPFGAKPGQPFSATLTVANRGVNAISSVDIEASVNGKSQEGLAYTLTPATIQQGKRGTLTISGLVSDEEGANIPVETIINKVNGEANETLEAAASDRKTAIYTEGYPRNFVVEEWTGTWCGYCPRGIVGMSYMRQNYGKDRFIGIAVHGQDEMSVNAYNPFLYEYANTYPGCLINRTVLTDLGKEEFEYYYNLMKDDTSYATVDELTAQLSEDNQKELTVNASVKFTVPANDGDYRLAFVVTEDNVGPYQQLNFYAGSNVDMGGWEKMSYRQYTYFDEVARTITDAFGTPGSLPSDIEADTPYTYSTKIAIRNVQNLNASELKVLVLDGESGVVVNAAKLSLYEAGVEKATAEGIEISAEPGAVVVSGEYADCAVYGIDGRIMALGRGAERIAVTPGIYMVKVTDRNGSAITRKVIVI